MLVSTSVSAAPPPPLHAINRGLGTEGLGTMLAGLWGSGNGTNTFGENVGAIGVTKVRYRKAASSCVRESVWEDFNVRKGRFPGKVMDFYQGKTPRVWCP